MNYERKQSLMSAEEIQRDLDLIRLAYRQRNMQPLNHRLSDLPWLALGMVIGTVIALVIFF